MDLDPDVLEKIIETFKSELEDQLQVITDGLLLLEKTDPTSPETVKTIEGVFRSAHNIKGSARGLSIDNVGMIAHEVETLFAAIQQHKQVITPAVISLCLETVDAMRSAMQSFLDKQPLRFSIEDLLSQLRNVDKLQQQTPISAPAPAQAPAPTKESTPATKKEPTATPTPNPNDYNEHESIRVELTNLDRASALMEEIQVNKIAIDDHYFALAKLIIKTEACLTNWKKLASALQSRFGMEWFTSFQKQYNLHNDSVHDVNNLSHQLQKNMRPRVNELAILSNTLQEEIRMLRLIPVSTLLRTLPRIVRDLSQELGKRVELVTHGDHVKIDKMVLEGLKDPLIHLLRNAIDHGIESPDVRKAKGKPETGRISIAVKEAGHQIQFTVSDDGAGIDSTYIRDVAKNKNLISHTELETMNETEVLDLIFKPGFSTKSIITAVSGRGVGLDVVKTNLNHLKGTIRLHTEMGKGTRFILRVPLTLASERGLLIKSSSQLFVVPISAVERVMTLGTDEIVELEASHAIRIDNHPIPLRGLATILGLKEVETLSNQRLHVVVLKEGSQTVALVVEDILGEREIVIKPLQPPLQTIPCVTGGTLAGNGEVIIVLSIIDIMTQALHAPTSGITFKEENKQTAVKPRILVVDDSITTRTLERSVLETKGYDVTVAVNGKEAWDILQKQTFALLITDVSMPVMDGFTLTENVKKHSPFHEMPVIIVTSLDSEEEKKRGIDVGADAYIVKNEFESSTLLDIVSQLL